MSIKYVFHREYQEYRSYMTSINTKKLPRIYNQLDWDGLYNQVISLCKDGNPPVVLDIGCGRETTHIKQFVESRGFNYLPYDPYWLDKAHNAAAMYIPAHVVICSNVLNVIKEDNIVEDIHNLCKLKGGAYYYISVYEGNKSGEGKESKKDCWQRNQSLLSYKHPYDEYIKHGILTSSLGGWYIK